MYYIRYAGPTFLNLFNCFENRHNLRKNVLDDFNFSVQISQVKYSLR
jgi:hypothetical protein